MGMQQSEVEPEKAEVSTHLATLTLPTNLNTPTLRKRFTPQSPKHPPGIGCIKFSSLQDDAQTPPSPEPEYKPKPVTLSKKSKIYPFRNRSAEEFTNPKSYSFEKRSSSRDSSDLEYDNCQSRKQKNVSYKNEEKSQLICYKDDNKIITIKNDSKLTKYNTFDMKYNKRGKMTKYKSLDESEPKQTLVKYLDKHSNVSISAQDFDSDFKLLKYDNKGPRRDIICDTVDAWAKKGNRGVFSNLKHSLFKHSNAPEKAVVYKPLVFGGTFPIDCPMEGASARATASASTTPVESKGKEKFQTQKARSEHNVNRDVNLSFMSKPLKMREYGPAKSFDIDAPF